MKTLSTLRLLPLALIAITACSPKLGPYSATNKVYAEQAETFAQTLQKAEPVVLADSVGRKIPSEWVGTVNFNLRKPNLVIIHYTAQDSAAQTLKTFTLVKPQVSAHYVIGADGKIYHMLNDYLRAWHGGVGRWGSVTDINSSSIGIELDNNGRAPFNPAQINSLLALLAQLKKTYNIPTANFIGHQDIAPARKIDPGKLFPWQLLAQKGFGYWSDDLLELAPDNFDTTTALRLIGYDTGNYNAAVQAFKNHFVQQDNLPQLSQLDLNVLYNVYQKY
ncbi:MAG: N-acetylmuramoyl-L-alanine amidase [Mucilaginibacter sp.]